MAAVILIQFAPKILISYYYEIEVAVETQPSKYGRILVAAENYVRCKMAFYLTTLMDEMPMSR